MKKFFKALVVGLAPTFAAGALQGIAAAADPAPADKAPPASQPASRPATAVSQPAAQIGGTPPESQHHPIDIPLDQPPSAVRGLRG